MRAIKNAFCEHPASVGETWAEHAGAALGFAWRLQHAALAALIHAVFPFLCVKTASERISQLHERMVTHRVRYPAKPRS